MALLRSHPSQAVGTAAGTDAGPDRELRAGREHNCNSNAMLVRRTYNDAWSINGRALQCKLCSGLRLKGSTPAGRDLRSLMSQSPKLQTLPSTEARETGMLHLGEVPAQTPNDKQITSQRGVARPRHPQGCRRHNWH